MHTDSLREEDSVISRFLVQQLAKCGIVLYLHNFCISANRNDAPFRQEMQDQDFGVFCFLHNTVIRVF